MKKNYDLCSNFLSGKIKRSSLNVFSTTLLLLLPSLFTAQQTWTFTPCGATGRFGPTQLQANTAYTNTNLQGSVTVTGNGIQTWTVPVTGLYRVEANGAQGGTESNVKYGGRGASMAGDFNFTAGQVLKILVGQVGGATATYYGGGGGSFVSTIGNTPLCVAGGGGGAGGTGGGNGVDATITPTGTAGQSGGTGGVNGNGGFAVSTNGGSGGGFFTDGTGTFNLITCSVSAGLAFINGGDGGQYTTWLPGGFGGGGGGWSSTGNGGGGGGYSGGGTSGASYTGGGGGGSYNAGTNQLNVAGTYTGDGKVLITSLCYITLTSPTNPICAGQSATLNTNAVGNYSWSTGSTASFIVVSPSVTTVYTVVGTSTMNCMTSAAITITVSPGLPVLSVVSSTNSLCLGKTATLTANGALTYTWTNGVVNGASYSPSVTNTYTVTGQNGCGTSTAVTTITVAPLVVTAFSSPSVICASDPSTLTASAAATLYTWQPFTGTLTGQTVILNPSVTTLYTVTASDGTCAGTTTVLITAKPTPTLTVSASATMVCEGYPVNLSVSGGLNYTWSPGNLPGNAITVSPMVPTQYTVVGTNSLGCSSMSTQVIITSPSPTISIAASNTFICSGNAVNITASGGNAYTWSNGPVTASITVNPVTTTIYTVTGSAANSTCTASRTVEITVFTPTMTTSTTPTICSGSNATLMVSGADTYLWDNASTANLLVVSPTISTIYTVTGSTFSNNVTCSIVKTIAVNVNPLPNVTAAASAGTLCRFEKLTLTSTGAGNYTWTSASGLLGTGNSIQITPTLAIIYTYSVVGVDANGCANTGTVQVKVNACTGISESQSAGTNIFVYPNPNNGEFKISSDSDIMVSIVNELGQTVRVITFGSVNDHSVKISDLAPGIYFVKGQNDQGRVNHKIIVEK